MTRTIHLATDCTFKTHAAMALLCGAMLLAAAPSLAAQEESQTCDHHDPVWSADGERLLFYANRAGNFDLYSVRPDGSELLRLTDDPRDEVEPAWSPDGDRIAFAIDEGEHRYRLWLMAPVDGRPLGGDASAPDRSEPSTGDPAARGNRGAAGDTIALARLAPADMRAAGPAWSPDGSRVAFAGTENDNTDIYVVDPDGGEPRRLTRDAARDLRPAWSPDGSRIAFQSDRGGHYRIWVMDAEGDGDPRPVTGDGNAVTPAWSPDGTELVVASDRDGSLDLYRIPLDGSPATRLTNAAHDMKPAWSPDGEWIAFWSNRTGAPAIHVIRADGSELRTVVAGCDEAAAGAAPVTAERLMAHVHVLAHDSMRGRATPSPELERTANYVTARLHDAGARPFGDAGGWIQRFDILTTRFDTARAGLEVDGERRFALGGELKLLFDHGIRWEPATGETVVVHGALSDPSDVDPFALDGAIVLLVHPAGPDGDFAPGLGEILNPVMVRPDPPAVIIVSERSAAHRARADTILGTVRSENGWTSPRALNHGVFELHADDVRPLLARRAFDLDDAFASADEPVRATRLPRLDLRLPMPRQVLERRSAPNVVGLIEGSDPEFRDEYVVVLAHMDHIGVGEPDASGDSIYNGADDNASGTAALIEIARAIGAMPRAPARSVIFLATGGEEQGLQGGDYFTLHPPAPLERMGAAVNLDGIGGFWMPDTVAVIGRDDFPRLGAVVDRVAARHPELGLSPVGNVLPELNYTFADQVNFARRGVPSIFFSSSGPQDHFHRPGDEPEVVDPDALERITRLVLHTVVAIADRAEGFERDE